MSDATASIGTAHDRTAPPSVGEAGASPNPAIPHDVHRALRESLSEFNVGLALMSVIPLLLCCYLITVKFFSLSILVGLNAVYFLLAVIIAVLGILTGRRAIRRIVHQLVEANLRAAQLLNDLTGANERLRQANGAMEQLHEELQAAQMRLIQAGRLEAVGQLAAGMAHEVKNPLMAILAGAEYLSKHLAGSGALPQEEMASVVKDIEDSVNRADGVVRGLLDFSTAEQFQLAVSPLNPVIEQALSFVKHELEGHRVTVAAELDGELPLVRIDPQKIQQVFVNLFMNAIQAMPSGGTLTVRTRAKPLDTIAEGIGRRRSDQFKVGETAVVADVLDTGPGILEYELGRLFTPFFTTKQPGKGTGLGLTVSKKIIELHGGLIEIRNQPEGGVAATLMLHACQAESPTTKSAPTGSLP